MKASLHANSVHIQNKHTYFKLEISKFSVARATSHRLALMEDRSREMIELSLFAQGIFTIGEKY